MTTGLHTTNMANAVLNVLSGTTFTGKTNTYLKLHTGDPGASGTANEVSPAIARKVMSWAAAASGSKAINATISWTSWAAGTETIQHVSIWDTETEGTGNVLWSGPLSSPKTVNDGDTLNITSLTAAFTPLMA